MWKVEGVIILMKGGRIYENVLCEKLHLKVLEAAAEVFV